MKTTTIMLVATLVPALALAACDDPAEKAGKEQDKAAAVASGQPYSGDGPGERLGEAQEKAETAAREARETSAKALKQQGKEIETQADVTADRLEDQAKALRESAERKADALADRADTVKP